MFHKLEKTAIGSYVLTKLNVHVTDYINPPTLDKPPRRNVLVISAHPLHDSLNGALLSATTGGLRDAGHDVRVRRLYFDASCPEENYNGGTFPPLLQPNELIMYSQQLKGKSDHGNNTVQSPLILAKEVAEAIEDLQWCNALVLVYPTWWSSFPAILKGFFDRVLLPGVSFKFSDDTVTRPVLSHITRIGVVTTYQQSRWMSLVYGDSARSWISSTLRSYFSSDCTLTWRGVYNVEILQQIKTDKENCPQTSVCNYLNPEIEETADVFRHF